MQKDDSIKHFFDGYNPSLPSDSDFMAGLSRNIDALEVLRRHNLQVKRVNRRSIVLAIAVGIVIGIFFNVLWSRAAAAVGGINISLPVGMSFPDVDIDVIKWLVITAATAIITLNVYESAFNRFAKD